MKVIPFWGCMIPLKYPQMEKAVRYSLARLDVELEEERRFSCCPDPIYFKAGDKLTWLTIAARNLALAEEKGLDVITMCSGCTSTLCEVNHHLKQDEQLRKKVNQRLKLIGRQFRGTINVRHVVTLLRDEVSFEKIQETVTHPISALKVAIHYGCHLLKPSEIMKVDDPVMPIILEKLFAVTGSVPINHQDYLLCCGKACNDAQLTLNMSHDVFRSVMESGADCLGLICPTCFDSFDVGQLRVSRKFGKDIQVPVFYYFQLLALAQGASLEEVGIQYHKIMPVPFKEKLQRTAMLSES